MKNKYTKRKLRSKLTYTVRTDKGNRTKTRKIRGGGPPLPNKLAPIAKYQVGNANNANETAKLEEDINRLRKERERLRKEQERQEKNKKLIAELEQIMAPSKQHLEWQHQKELEYLKANEERRQQLIAEYKKQKAKGIQLNLPKLKIYIICMFGMGVTESDFHHFNDIIPKNVDYKFYTSTSGVDILSLLHTKYNIITMANSVINNLIAHIIQLIESTTYDNVYLYGFSMGGAFILRALQILYKRYILTNQTEEVKNKHKENLNKLIIKTYGSIYLPKINGFNIENMYRIGDVSLRVHKVITLNEERQLAIKLQTAYNYNGTPLSALLPSKADRDDIKILCDKDCKYTERKWFKIFYGSNDEWSAHSYKSHAISDINKMIEDREIELYINLNSKPGYL